MGCGKDILQFLQRAIQQWQIKFISEEQKNIRENNLILQGISECSTFDEDYMKCGVEIKKGKLRVRERSEENDMVRRLERVQQERERDTT